MLKEINYSSSIHSMKKLNQTITRLFFLIVLFGSGFTVFGQVIPTLEWATHGGGGGFDSGTAIDVDDLGNVYTVGYFSSPGNFSNSTTSPIIPDFKGQRDIFVTKQDPQGNTLWVQSMGGPGLDYGPGIAVDADGNVYVTGYFQAPSAVFGPESFNVFAGGGDWDRDAVVTKFNTNGDFEWTQRFGGTNQDRGQSITIDGSGDIYVAGYFSSSTAEFGSITLNKKTLNNNGTTYDSFVTKLDPSGTVLWAINFGGDNQNTSVIKSIIADNAGDLYVTGAINSGSLFIDSYTLSSKGFVAKLNDSGDVLWAKEVGGGGHTVAVDNLGYVYTTGHYSGTQDFGTFSLTATPSTSAPFSKIYLCKQDAETGDFIWAKEVAGEQLYFATSHNHKVMAVDNSGNIYRTGRYKGEDVDFDPGSGTYEISSMGTSADFFINVLDTDGEFVWARGFECTGEASGLGINIDNKGAIYSTGYFMYNSEFDPGPSSFPLSTYGSADAFVQKLIDCSLYSGNVSSLDEELCEGDTLRVTASNGIEFEWTGPNGFTSQDPELIIENIEASASGTYQVITKSEFCSDTILVNVTVFPTPNISFTADPSEGSVPLDVTFENTSTGSNTYWWDFDDGFTEQNDDLLVYHTFDNEGVYNTSLIGISDDGCVDTATITITVNTLPSEMTYEFPNVFTPNGDNQNDLFLLINPQNIESVEIFIVNRWGSVVYESDEILFSWNGNHLNSGAECTDGTYFYVAKLTDLYGKTVEEHGHITLVRSK